MKAYRIGLFAVPALVLAGVWGLSVRDLAAQEDYGPDAGVAQTEEESVVPAPTREMLAAMDGANAPMSPEERKDWVIQQKLEMARGAVAAAEAAGTRELRAEDIEENLRGRSESAKKKMERLAGLTPPAVSALPGTQGAPGTPGAERAASFTSSGNQVSASPMSTSPRPTQAFPGSPGFPRALNGSFDAQADATASSHPPVFSLQPTAGQHAAALALEDDGPLEECTEGFGTVENFAGTPYCQAVGFLTDDTCHYARGTTLIIHVFVNHGTKTWDGDERGQSIAKANQAKDWYRATSPSNAYMRFDHDDTGIGYYVVCDLPEELPDPGAHAWVDDVCAALGFVDNDGDGFLSDDLSLWYQNQYGGWDNVIAVFQPADVFFTATASMERGACKIPPSATWQTWAHEWGHCFGANDEYGSCNGLGCGDIAQSCYLTDDVPNGNCESDPCGTSLSCMMKFNSAAVPPCSFTQRHWAWIDDNGDNLLDTTLWNDAGTAENLYELYHNGYFIHTNTDWGMVANQRWESWSVVGLRARDTAQYNLRVYGDNNYRYHQASSTGHASGYVNYVVGDFNRNNLGQDFIDVQKVAGNGQYVLAYESGTGMLYPDGVDRAQTWQDYNVVRAFDVPLFGGETITFDLDILTAGLDLGMALYKSNPGGGTTPYYRGRTNGAAQWEADSWGSGSSENFTFTVPQDDVYGLIVWSNNEVAGDWEIKIGPTPYTLAEATPHTSFLDLRLYNYIPAANFWAVAAVRPEPSVDVSMSLFAESTYATELASSHHYGDVEFVAANYNHGASTDYLRVERTSGVSSFTTEWEQGTEIFNGFELDTWENGHICKVWDTYLEAGMTYFVRLYGGSAPNVDADIFLMSSAGGDDYRQRILRSAESTGHSGGDGEWFTYTAPVSDWYGFVVVAQDDGGGADDAYAIGIGPKVSLAENIPVSDYNEIVWGDVSVQSGAWNVVGLRSDEWMTGQIGFWGCSNFAASCYLGGDVEASGVTFVAIDGRELAAGTYYPRFDRRTGSGQMTASFDVAGSAIIWDGVTPPAAVTGNWTEDEVAQATDLYVRVPVDALYIEVTPLEPGMDLAVAVVRNSGGGAVQGSYEALETENNGGAGEVEVLELVAPPTSVYGLIVTNQNGVPGEYRIRVLSETPTSDVAEVTGSRLDFRMASANPSSDEASFSLSLPSRDHVEVSIFDVRGRRVRSLADGTMDPGQHAVRWDGKDDLGHSVVGGVYLARLETRDESRVVKLVRAE